MCAFLFLVAMTTVSGHGPSYPNCKDLTDGYQLKWQIMEGNLYIWLSAPVVVQNMNTWVALGLAQTSASAMTSSGKCSDIVISSAGACPDVTPLHSNCNGHDCTACVDDLWVCDYPPENSVKNYLLLHSRDKDQNWALDSVVQTETRVNAKLHRLLDTGDSQDLPIAPGVQYTVIWAFGENDLKYYLEHAPGNKGSLQLDFYQESTCQQVVGDITESPYYFQTASQDFVAKWIFLEDTSEVVMRVQAKTSGWAAVGFAPQLEMEGADVVVAYFDENNHLQLYDGYAVGLEQPPLDTAIGGTNDITNYTGWYENGFLTFQFTRKLNTKDSKDYDLSIYQVYMLYAMGNLVTTSSGVQLKEHHTEGGALVDFFVPQPLESASEITYDQIHGIIMALAWFSFLYPGSIIGRKYRLHLSKWFICHVICQVIGVILFMTSVIIIFYDHAFELHVSFHSIFGLCTLVGVCLQVIFGIISNRFAGLREMMHVLHDWSGRVTLINAWITMIIAFYFYGTGYWGYILLALWCLTYLFLYLSHLKTYQQLQKEKEKKQKKDIAELEEMDEPLDQANEENEDELNNENEEESNGQNNGKKKRKERKQRRELEVDDSDHDLHVVAPKIMTRPATLILAGTIVLEVVMSISLSVLIYLTLHD